MKNPVGLSKDDSLIIKGVAILAMMWNHCFLKGRFEQFDISFFPLGQSVVTDIAAFAKVCVSFFAFVSGYGLFCSLAKEWDDSYSNMPKGLSVWYLTRYTRSFSDYWLIVLLACVLCQLVNGRTEEVFFKDSAFTGCFYILMNILGLSSIVDTPMLIGTWWYMSAALIYILLAPLAFWAIVRFSGILCFGIVLIGVRAIGLYPGGTNYLSFLPAFILGMMCAKVDLFEKLRCFVEQSKVRYLSSVILIVVLSAACYKFNNSFPTKKFWDFKFGLFVPVYLCAIYLILKKVPLIAPILKFLGEWSADIFLTHSFFRVVYMKEFMYSPGNFFFVMARVLVLGLLASFIFRIIKRIMHYDSFVSWLLCRAGRFFARST